MIKGIVLFIIRRADVLVSREFVDGGDVVRVVDMFFIDFVIVYRVEVVFYFYFVLFSFFV